MEKEDEALQWDINSSQLKIRESKVVMISVSKLNTHPDNRPLGASEEKIRQLKILISNSGFDSSHPLVVRPYSQGYQIIEGEHRFKAAKTIGYLDLPCVVRDLDDTEALIQLVLGNIQSESKPLEIGLNALKVIQREGTYSVSEYARRLGAGETTVRRYMNASETYQFIKNQLPEGTPILDEVYKLEEIHRCPQSDWLWLHDLVMKRELSKNQVIEISQALREIKTDNPKVYALFDFMRLRQEIAQNILSGNKQMSVVYKELIQIMENSYDNLEVQITSYEYNVLNDAIQTEDIYLKDWFIDNLKEIKTLTKQSVLETYKDALQLKRNSSKEEAERTATYFQDKKNAKEREEQERLEREMRQVKSGEWWVLGQHHLYCGEGSSPDFFEKIPRVVSLAYLNPPNLVKITKTDGTMAWQFDHFIQKAEIVVATPPLESLQDFFKLSQMPYQWSLSAQLNLKKGEGNLGAWVYAAVFSNKSIHTNTKDSWRIDASDLQGNRTQDFLEHLVESFSRPQEVVVDAYAGRGTLFMIAEAQHRICYGAEKDPDLCRAILEKWEELSGQKAKRIS
jgi:ParB/RepB/Spo0J family partition protein